MSRRLRIAAVLVAVVTTVFPAHAGAQSGFNNAGPFLGTWCAQGDPSRRASIAANGPFNLTLTNENGSTSTGIMTGGPGAQQISAPRWNLVQGTLSADGKTITWSNNTYWARCRRHTNVNVQGTWYVAGDPSRACRIDQRNDGSMTLRNEIGQTGSGSFTGSHHIATSWSGTSITGTIARSQNRIDWSNGTYWTR